MEKINEKQILLPDLRHVIAHLQLVKEEDIPRFKKLGILANFSPFWRCYNEEWKHDKLLLGEKRAENQFKIRDMINNGVNVSFGSDWPVTEFDPLTGIEIAVTRKPVGFEGKTDFPEKDQRINVKEAINCYTLEAAYSLHRNDEVGSLEVGKEADLVVLDSDILECKGNEIHNAKVVMTMIGGVIVYNRE